jgi:hypothetical protein
VTACVTNAAAQLVRIDRDVGRFAAGERHRPRAIDRLSPPVDDGAVLP